MGGLNVGIIVRQVTNGNAHCGLVDSPNSRVTLDLDLQIAADLCGIVRFSASCSMPDSTARLSHYIAGRPGRYLLPSE